MGRFSCIPTLHSLVNVRLKVFVTYIVVAFLVITLAEALHHIPGLEALNAFGTDHMALQLITLFAGIAAYVLITLLSFKTACRRFEQIDL